MKSIKLSSKMKQIKNFFNPKEAWGFVNLLMLCFAVGLAWGACDNEHRTMAEDPQIAAYVADTLWYETCNRVGEDMVDGSVRQGIDLRKEWEQDSLMLTLVSYYNAMQVHNDFVSWIDAYGRFLEGSEAYCLQARSMDCSGIQDSGMRAATRRCASLVGDMFYLLFVDEGNDDEDTLFDWDKNFFESEQLAHLSENYDLADVLTAKFNRFNEVDDDEFGELVFVKSHPAYLLDTTWTAYWKDSTISDEDFRNRMRTMMNEKDYDRQVAELVALMGMRSHCLEVGDTLLGLAESMMESGRYSTMLFNLWRAYRVMHVDVYGCPSTWCGIANDRYNHYRRLVAYTVLNYFDTHRYDKQALALFDALSVWDNILRFGDYPFGNQSAAEYIYLYWNY